LFCVNKTANLHNPLLKSRVFCVNILRAWQSELAQAFGSKDGRYTVGLAEGVDWVIPIAG
jgi:flavin reductase (DIM6/NTAB) family NADH-FMN oxidoreductase RutF